MRSHWYKPASSASLVDVQWGYDRGSVKTWRKDALAPSGAEQDQYFNYDNRYQVTQRQRGVLNSGNTGIVGTPAQQEAFGYDPAGNWNTYQQNNAGTLDINQTRAHNASNQITSIDSVSTGVSYDNNGNMLSVPTNGQELDGPSRKLVWDAWNRLRKVLDENDNVIAEYQYDGLMRRTTSTVSSTVRHFYYDDQWRSVEERLGSATTPERQHVWQPGDRWQMILRDRSTANNGVLDERLYSLKDELDPVALSDTSGNVVERYAYNAFGKASFFDASYTARTSLSYEWNFLFHGEFADAETGWMNYGFRYYSVDLGRWLSEDPLGYTVGLNYYKFLGNEAITKYDILGLVDLNLAAPTDPAYNFFTQIPKINSLYTVGGHSHEGTSPLSAVMGDYRNGHDRLTAPRLAEEIKKSGWKEGQPIMLIGCETGKGACSLASEVAAALDTYVAGMTEQIFPPAAGGRPKIAKDPRAFRGEDMGGFNGSIQMVSP